MVRFFVRQIGGSRRWTSDSTAPEAQLHVVEHCAIDDDDAQLASSPVAFSTLTPFEASITQQRALCDAVDLFNTPKPSTENSEHEATMCQGSSEEEDIAREEGEAAGTRSDVEDSIDQEVVSGRDSEVTVPSVISGALLQNLPCEVNSDVDAQQCCSLFLLLRYRFSHSQ